MAGNLGSGLQPSRAVSTEQEGTLGQEEGMGPSSQGWAIPRATQPKAPGRPGIGWQLLAPLELNLDAGCQQHSQPY